MTTSERRLRVLVLEAAKGTGAMVRDAIESAMPEASVAVASSSAGRTLPPNECIVVVARASDGELTLRSLRGLRAGGYECGLVVLATGLTEEEMRAAKRLGATVVDAGAPADTIAETIRQACPPEEIPPELKEMRRSWHLIAVGELAQSLQHALNNPLTALLAEAQLLEMELEDGEQREAVQRMVELVRRMIGLVRELGARP